MAFCTTFSAKVSETRWTQVLGTLFLIINELQKSAFQGLDVKNRRCKSWFSATPAPSFILPKWSPYLPFCLFCRCFMPYFSICSFEPRTSHMMCNSLPHRRFVTKFIMISRLKFPVIDRFSIWSIPDLESRMLVSSHIWSCYPTLHLGIADVSECPVSYNSIQLIPDCPGHSL